MKKKPAIHFDPHDYDYLDTLDKDGWHWEFTRRNVHYQKDYEKMERLRKEGEDYCKNLNCFSCKVIAKKPCPLSHAFDVDNTFQIKSFFKTSIGLNMPAPSLKYSDLPDEAKPVALIRPISPMKTLTGHEIKEAIRQTWEDKKNEFEQIGHSDPKYAMFSFVNEILSPNPDEQKDTLYIGISAQATRDELRIAFNNVLKKYVKPKNKQGDKKQTPASWKNDLMIWDIRIFKNTCGDVAKIIGIAKDTVKKQFFRTCELIYNLPYKKIEHHLKYPKTREEDIMRYCNNCSKKPDCKEPCPDKIALAVYDFTYYQREQTFGDIETLQKYAQKYFNPSAHEDELIDAIDKRASLKKQ